MDNDYTEWFANTAKKINLRKTESCANCIHGVAFWGGEGYCSNYTFTETDEDTGRKYTEEMCVMGNDICDNYVRKEVT